MPTLPGMLPVGSPAEPMSPTPSDSVRTEVAR
ncbi:hypothetical protein FrEUN1fDRAFT_2544 [Parafrankia sp. EUN1f]|nr:hypothetical protein FrEUN1fDRAFT_2544 [Parafrankia sp. EUN1f]